MKERRVKQRERVKKEKGREGGKTGLQQGRESVSTEALPGAKMYTLLSKLIPRYEVRIITVTSLQTWILFLVKRNMGKKNHIHNNLVLSHLK